MRKKLILRIKEGRFLEDAIKRKLPS